jgi:hypothetical protein
LVPVASFQDALDYLAGLEWLWKNTKN